MVDPEELTEEEAFYGPPCGWAQETRVTGTDVILVFVLMMFTFFLGYMVGVKTTNDQRSTQVKNDKSQ